MKYDITYKCGHEGTVDLVGPYAQRERRLDNLRMGLCPECEEKKQEECLEQFEKENELPELTGSPKQIAWARNIRRIGLVAFEKLSETFEEEMREAITRSGKERHMEDKVDDAVKKHVGNFEDAIAYVTEQTTSRFFIDNRDALDYSGCCSYPVGAWKRWNRTWEEWAHEYRDAHDVHRIEAEKEAKEIEQRVQVTVEPVNKEHDTIVTLRKKDGGVHLFSDYDRDLVGVIHELPLKMKWNKVSWEFAVEEFRGTFESVIAEIGNILLSNGFMVVFPNQETADMAVSGNFKRYIRNAFYKMCERVDYVILRYDENDDDVYKNIRSIPRANTMSGKSIIDVASYESIEELMEANPDTFAMSDACKDVIESYKKSKMIAQPVVLDEVKYNKPGRKEVDLSDLNDD